MIVDGSILAATDFSESRVKKFEGIYDEILEGYKVIQENFDREIEQAFIEMNLAFTSLSNKTSLNLLQGSPPSGKVNKLFKNIILLSQPIEFKLKNKTVNTAFFECKLGFEKTQEIYDKKSNSHFKEFEKGVLQSSLKKHKQEFSLLPGSSGDQTAINLKITNSQKSIRNLKSLFIQACNQYDDCKKLENQKGMDDIMEFQEALKVQITLMQKKLDDLNDQKRKAQLITQSIKK